VRIAGSVDLVVPYVLIVFLAAVTTGCGGAALSPADSGAADGSRDGSPVVAIPGVTGLVAGNGVPIPDPPLHDPCATLGVAVRTCGPTDACPALTCACGGVQQTIEVAGSCIMFGACLTGVSCPAACSNSDLLAAGNLSACVEEGSCMTDKDCTNPARPRCLVALDGAGGHCGSGQVNSECYRDADCSSSVCVAVAPGSRVCVDEQTSSICNRDDQCAAPMSGTGQSHCVLPPGTFLGSCSAGTNGSPCVTSDECLAGYGCALQGAVSILGECTSHAQGAPCAVNGDCAQNRCVSDDPNHFGVCDTGALGTRCVKASDCLSGFCGGGACTTGAKGAPCIIDADCSTHLCAGPGAGVDFVAQCTDGMEGSACWGRNSAQCEAGLVCDSGGGAGTCFAVGSVGAPCQQDSDCLSQTCALPLIPIPNVAVCTEGMRGQRCHDSSQCDAGLHCLSNGTLGVCVAGVPGDPCRVAGDCASGTCLDMVSPSASCAGVANLGSCGAGSCVAGECLPVCM
jgi:hypothetical protein